MLKAKRGVEMALACGRAVIDLLMVEDQKVLSDEFGAAGIAAAYGGCRPRSSIAHGPSVQGAGTEFRPPQRLGSGFITKR